MHLIDKHTFPKDYDFYIVNDGIDHRNSMLRSGRHRRKSSAAQHMIDIEDRARRRDSTRQIATENPDVSEEESIKADSPGDPKILTPPGSQNDTGMDSLTGAMSSLKFVPQSVRFGRGRGRGRGGFSRT